MSSKAFVEAMLSPGKSVTVSLHSSINLTLKTYTLSLVKDHSCVSQHVYDTEFERLLIYETLIHKRVIKLTSISSCFQTSELVTLFKNAVHAHTKYTKEVLYV